MNSNVIFHLFIAYNPYMDPNANNQYQYSHLIPNDQVIFIVLFFLFIILQFTFLYHSCMHT